MELKQVSAWLTTNPKLGQSTSFLSVPSEAIIQRRAKSCDVLRYKIALKLKESSK